MWSTAKCPHRCCIISIALHKRLNSYKSNVKAIIGVCICEWKKRSRYWSIYSSTKIFTFFASAFFFRYVYLWNISKSWSVRLVKWFNNSCCSISLFVSSIKISNWFKIQFCYEHAVFNARISSSFFKTNRGPSAFAIHTHRNIIIIPLPLETDVRFLASSRTGSGRIRSVFLQTPGAVSSKKCFTCA